MQRHPRRDSSFDKTEFGQIIDKGLNIETAPVDTSLSDAGNSCFLLMVKAESLIKPKLQAT